MKSVTINANDDNFTAVYNQFMFDCAAESVQGDVEHHAQIIIVNHYDADEAPQVLMHLTLAVDIAASQEVLRSIKLVLSNYDTAFITLIV